MIDEKDVEKLKKAFLTKEQFLEYGVKKDDLEKSEHRIEDKIVEFKSEILTGQDEILKELKALRQEKIVGDGQDKRQKIDGLRVF